jgi:hypothetical protein
LIWALRFEATNELASGDGLDSQKKSSKENQNQFFFYLGQYRRWIEQPEEIANYSLIWDISHLRKSNPALSEYWIKLIEKEIKEKDKRKKIPEVGRNCRLKGTEGREIDWRSGLGKFRFRSLGWGGCLCGEDERSDT